MGPRRLRPILLAAAFLLAACGNISNEDLQFMAVLPDETLAVAVPSYSSQEQTPEQEVDGVATAADAADRINKVTTVVAKAVQTLRLRSPSHRSTGHRVWGPYSLSGEPGFYELVMNRVSSVSCTNPDDPIESIAPGYQWTIQGATSPNGSYQTLATGTVLGLEFNHSCGTFSYDSSVNRELGGDMSSTDPSSFSVAWTRGAHGNTLQITVTPSASGQATLVQGTTYDFRSLPAGGGHFNFAERYPVPASPSMLHVVVGQLEWGPESRPWRLDWEITNTTGTELSHGVSCGDVLGDRTTKDSGAPSASFDVSSDANCTFAYGAGG